MTTTLTNDVIYEAINYKKQSFEMKMICDDGLKSLDQIHCDNFPTHFVLIFLFIPLYNEHFNIHDN